MQYLSARTLSKSVHLKCFWYNKKKTPVCWLNAVYLGEWMFATGSIWYTVLSRDSIRKKKLTWIFTSKATSENFRNQACVTSPYKCERAQNQTYKTARVSRVDFTHIHTIFNLMYLKALIQIIVHKKYLFQPSGIKNATYTIISPAVQSKNANTPKSDLCQCSDDGKKSFHMFQECNREKVMRHMWKV